MMGPVARRLAALWGAFGGPVARWATAGLGLGPQPSQFPDPAPLPATRQDLLARLNELGIASNTVEHEAVFTVAESSKLERELPGGHTKNLFLKDKKGALYLVTALEDATIELKSLHRLIGASGRLSFGSAEQMREALGVEPGAVTPFGTINDAQHRIAVLLDAALMAHQAINAHPLVNTMTTTIGRDDLIKFLRATGHEPRIIAFALTSPQGE